MIDPLAIAATAAPNGPPVPVAAGQQQAGLTGVDGYPHQWVGRFPDLPIEQPATDIRPATFAAALAEMALTIKNEAADGSADAIATVITQAAAAVITGAQHTAVTTTDRQGRIVVSADHGDLAAAVTELHNALGEGPCLDAAHRTTQILASDMMSESRWPTFTKAARKLGVTGVLCTPLGAPGNTPETLLLIATQPAAFDNGTAEVAAVFTAHASLAVSGVNDSRHLTAKADSRDLIGQAKGILMQRHQITADQAFRHLTHVSQNSNRKLRDIAHHLITTGHLPTTRPTAPGDGTD